jgi:hypothetical protein
MEVFPWGHLNSHGDAVTGARRLKVFLPIPGTEQRRRAQQRERQQTGYDSFHV